ncbi:hypothetical protein FHT02_003596 [Sphingomonas xinjiangensis]|uniref:CopG family transcriptional regulator n=1 Tax=Sphingomonas xinjiangensis TaxID=643568 RepID=A0A840YFW2_9SPHN|nr:hypothetical protein [Sphingomonas xinjiangensis]
MAITKRPKVSDEAATEAFISAAPDGSKTGIADPAPLPRVYEKGIQKGNKRQITLTINPELLRRVDETATKTGQTRAALINLAIFQALEGNVFGR